jgi:hypothetical protein
MPKLKIKKRNGFLTRGNHGHFDLWPKGTKRGDIKLSGGVWIWSNFRCKNYSDVIRWTENEFKALYSGIPGKGECWVVDDIPTVATYRINEEAKGASNE